MRKWLIRLRTVLAALAAVYLFWQLPVAARIITQPQNSGRSAPSEPRVLRVWVCEDWTGTGMQWILKQAGMFEKANKNVRVVVRRAQRDDWLAPGVVPPDVLLFGAGVMKSPEGVLAPFDADVAVHDFLASTGYFRGMLYAVPVCYGGYVRILNEAKAGNAELVMETEKEYQEFAQQKAHSLIATIREARRLAALEAAGKGFPFQTEPYGDSTDKLLMAGCFPSEGERATLSKSFVEFVLSDTAQNGLPELGLLPASATAGAPDERKQPLLFAMRQAVTQAGNAFD